MTGRGVEGFKAAVERWIGRPIRDISAPQVWDRIESFLENLGLTRLDVATDQEEECTS